MVIVELKYVVPLEEIEAHLAPHRAFLDTHYASGALIASGPKIPREGGVIIVNASLEEAKALMGQDPFYLNALAEYRYIEFDPIKRCEALQVL